MSNTVLLDVRDDAAIRAQRLAAAKKKLKAFSASRSTAQPPSSGTSASSSRLKSPLPSSAILPSPLTPTTADNCSPRQTRKPSGGKAKCEEAHPSPKPERLRKQRSKGSMGGHRRQQSSMSVGPGHGLARTSVVGFFDMPDIRPEVEEMSRLMPLVPSEIITTPATPLVDTPVFGYPTGDLDSEDVSAVKAKLSTFSFGSKSHPRSASPNGEPSASSLGLLPQDFTFSPTSPSPSPTTSSVSAPSDLNRLSTPASRPPSLLLTKPTPLGFGTPSSPGPSRNSLGTASGPPSTPPTPARRRHSHTRSESISLPNLKLSRPVSLGIPSSPSYPSSPCSPSSAGEGSAKSCLSGPINGTRLKFEPSGRGAEAEKEKDEYRRRALEKLTGGGRSPPMFENQSAEISLPDLDDDDRSSIASSTRPLSGAFSFTQSSNLGLPTLPSLASSPNPSILSASPFSWASTPEDDSSPTERWSGFGVRADEPREEGLGFGIDLAMTMSKRPSLARNLSVLAEVDEDVDLEEESGSDEDDEMTEHFTPMTTTEATIAYPSLMVAPTPVRLRELHLPSTVSGTPSSQPEPSPFTSVASVAGVPTSTSPTKGYGAIGRGRPHPRPLSGIPANVLTATTSSSPLTGKITTPRSAKRGSRGSSISYKKDGDSSQSSSSRDWSVGSKSFFSPPLDGLSSPPVFGSPGFSGWGNVPRSAGRPCPRPKNIAGLGLENNASGRVLRELDEAEEDGMSLPFHCEEGHQTGRPSSENSRASMQWRGERLELEMERDAFRDDANMWWKMCQGLEERLEAERKDGALLRERVRKLGDRLSSVSSSHPMDRSSPSPSPGPSENLVSDLRDQLFALTASLDHERRAKEDALAQLANFRSSRGSISTYSEPESPTRSGNTFRPSNLTLRQSDNTRLSAQPSIPTPIVTPATPLPDDPTDDPNRHRMKAWGFPRAASNPSRPSTKRDSFFGLSSIQRRDSIEDVPDGLDLPPFIVADAPTPQSKRSFSQPVPGTMRNIPMARSTSLTHSASSATSSALSIFSSYLPRNISPIGPRSPSASEDSSIRSSLSSETRRKPEPHHLDRLNFSAGCSCCVGDVIEF